ncbi:hypothetical protein KQI52_12600 [bacterium]|nr:hypothetical protein [bacterium]
MQQIAKLCSQQVNDWEESGMKWISRGLWFTMVLVLVMSLGLMGCEQTNDDDDDDSSPTEPVNEAPNLMLTVTPSTIMLGDQIHFDITNTTDDSDDPASMDFRWDYDGDGTWEEDWTEGLGLINTTPPAQGNFVVVVEARDSGGLTDRATANYSVNYENDPPNAALSVSPQNGTTYTSFTFDASASTDDHQSLSELTFRYDFNGDGVWDHGPSAETSVTHVYMQAGSFFPKVQVTDQDNESSTASVAVQTVEASDMTVLNVYSDDYQLEINEYFLLYATFRNDGAGSSQACRANIFWSHDNVLNTDEDFAIGYYEVPALNPGEETEMYQAPWNPTESDPEFDVEYIFIVVDYEEVLEESNEDNNIASIQVETVPTFGDIEDYYYDDGSFDNGSYWPGAGGGAAVLFNVPYTHYKIIGIWVYVYQSAAYVHLHQYPYTGGGSVFGEAVANYSNAYLYEGWNFYDLTWEVDGSEYFGLGFTTTVDGIPHWGTDASSVQYRSYFNQLPGTYAWSQSSTNNYGIRARIQPYIFGGALGEPFDIDPVRANSMHAPHANPDRAPRETRSK